MYFIITLMNVKKIFTYFFLKLQEEEYKDRIFYIKEGYN